MAIRTSHAQFLLLVDFMEKNGDLSKPSNLAHGRLWAIKKWKELTDLLNAQGIGELRSEDKWRKEEEQHQEIPAEPEMQIVTAIMESDNRGDEDWNTPGTSKDVVTPVPPIVIAVPPATPPESPVPLKSPTPPKSPTVPQNTPKPPPKLKQCKKKNSEERKIEEYFVKCEQNARQDVRERERWFAELERERIRQRDIELQQRDTELQLQAQWQEIVKTALGIIEKYLNGNEKST